MLKGYLARFRARKRMQAVKSLLFSAGLIETLALQQEYFVPFHDHEIPEPVFTPPCGFNL